MRFDGYSTSRSQPPIPALGGGGDLTLGESGDIGTVFWLCKVSVTCNLSCASMQVAVAMQQYAKS